MPKSPNSMRNSGTSEQTVNAATIAQLRSEIDTLEREVETWRLEYDSQVRNYSIADNAGDLDDAELASEAMEIADDEIQTASDMLKQRRAKLSELLK